MLTPFAAVVMAATTVADAATFHRLAADLGELRKTARTVEIEFTLERRNAVFPTPRTFTGKFVSVRESGGVSAMLQLRPDDDLGRAETYVLRGDEVTVWDARSKTVFDFPAAKQKGGFRFAADNYSGLLWLLDRDAAAKRLRVSVFKQDENYTYFTVAADEPHVLSFRDTPGTDAVAYRFAVVRRGSADLPVGAIRELARVKPAGDIEIYKVTKWAVDSPDHAKLMAEKLPDPAKLPQGWTQQTLTWPPIPPARD